LQDINENAPTFTSGTPRTLDLAEGTVVGTRVMGLTTNDKDSGLGAIADLTLQVNLKLRKKNEQIPRTTSRARST